VKTGNSVADINAGILAALGIRRAGAGRTQALGCPIHFSATPTRVDRGAPLLGEHTRAILREFGYDDDAIDALVAAGVVASASNMAASARE
jgi:crotonobetainyl-CoA:carnitine CoA-transferase CaiB-like acyl-CoA transferase